MGHFVSQAPKIEQAVKFVPKVVWLVRLAWYGDKASRMDFF